MGSCFIAFLGADGSNMVVTESNGDVALDSGEVWPSEVETEVVNPSSLILEEKPAVVTTFQEDGASMVEGELVDDNLEELKMEESHNCDRLSPQSELEDTEDDLTGLHTVYITPLDGCQAELRSRVIKEVRKPGRSEYKPADWVPSKPSVSSNLNLCFYLRLQTHSQSAAAGEGTSQCSEVFHPTCNQRSCEVRSKKLFLIFLSSTCFFLESL